MKRLKIITGFILLFGAGNEYINASQQLGSFFNLAIIITILLFLILCTWLIGSGFSSRKLKFKSFEFVKFFILSFVTFAAVAIFSMFSKVVPSDFVEINGLKIPLGDCIDGNRRIIPDQQEREEYCKCFIEKITNDPELKLKYQEKLENNKANEVFEEIQSNSKFLELGIEDCVTRTKMQWTDNIANTMEKGLKEELVGSEFKNTNNIDEYCSCLIKNYRQLPLDKVVEDDFLESLEAIEIQTKCAIQSKK